MSDYKSYAFFTYNSIGATGIPVTCSVYSTSGSVINNLSATEIGGGFYSFLYTPIVDGDYLFLFNTSASAVDVSQISSLYPNRQDAPSDTWSFTTRTLTGFGSLVSDIWNFGSRSLTSFGTLVSDIWANTTRSLTTFGSIVGDIWEYPTRTLSSFGTLVGDVWLNATRSLTDKADFSLTTAYDSAKTAASASTVSAIPALTAIETWTYPNRTLTSSASPVIVNVLASSDTGLICRRGDTFITSMQDLGSFENYSSIYFTVKEYYKKQSDSESIIQVALKTSGSSGLLYLNGASASSIITSASITVVDAVNGDITVTVGPLATKELTVSEYVYDIQVVTTASIVTTAIQGTFSVLGDVTRTIT